MFLLTAVLAAGMFGVAQTGAGSVAQAGEGSDPADFNSLYAPAYRLPDPAGMSAAAASGKELVHSTYRYLGAESAPRAANGLPYVGNKFACTSCHMADGTQPNASPLIVVAKKYAAPGIFSARENALRDVPVRVNGCFERSLAGEPLPVDSQWMKDIEAYLGFLATGIQPGYTHTQVPEQGYPAVAKLTRAADAVRGQTIYQDNCKSCHQEDGSGVWLADEKRYRYPALWGSNSFGLMSGMGRLSTTATMIHGTMPRDKVDVMNVSTRLSQTDAVDVSAYLLSKSHPYNNRFVSDWTGVGPSGMPNWLTRDSSASYDFTMPRSDAGVATDNPAMPPMFTREQHIYGPFQPIDAALKAARNARGYP
ncbi:MAG: c-type cytochrome [Dermatophilaceae bacterium]